MSLRDGVGDGPVLEVRDLRTELATEAGPIYPVDGVSFRLARGEIFGLVGESGSGKSMTALSILRLLPRSGRIVSGEVRFAGQDLVRLTEREMRTVRGRQISLVLQNPLTSLDPVRSIGWQLEEAITAHAPTTGSEVHRRAFEALRSVEIPEAAYRLADYPHQFSGGMRQRVAIAMALINGPSVLIADEPTTALDVTLQAHVLGLLRRLASDLQLAVLLITHDLATVGAVCDRVAVMYAGQVVEEGPVSDVFNSPQHPYTHGLLESRAAGHEEARRLPSMKGMPPELTAIPTGCRFVVRCPLAIAQCAQPPALLALDAARQARCWVSQRGGRLPEVIWE